MPKLNMDEFKALRHRFYKTGKFRRDILRAMGYLVEVSDDQITQDVERGAIFGIYLDGRIDELIQNIEEQEAIIAGSASG